MIAAAIASAAGTLVSGLGAASASSAQGAIADQNMKIAKINAEQTLLRGGKELEDIGQQQLGLIGELRAGVGASGIAFSSPTVKRKLLRSQDIAMINQLRKREAINQEATNFINQSNQYKAQADMLQQQATFQTVGAIVNTGASLLDSYIDSQKQSLLK